jgi:hypothetical protein
MAPVHLSASLLDMHDHPEVLTPIVNEEMAPCYPLPAPSASLPANVPTYAIAGTGQNMEYTC